MFGINFLKDIFTVSTNLVRKRILFFSLFAVSVKAQLENASMTVVSPINTTASSIIPYAIQQANNSHLWIAGAGLFDPDVNQDSLFVEFANGIQLSSIRLGGVSNQIVWDFIQNNNSIVFIGLAQPTPSTDYGAFIGELAIDSKTLLWLTMFGGPQNSGRTHYGRSLVPRNGGGYIVSGFTFSFGAGSADGMMLAFDNGGNILRSNTVGEPGEDYIMDMINTRDSGYAGVGSTRGSNSGGVYAISVYKFDNSEDLSWLTQIGGTADTFAESMIELENGHLKIVGSTQSFGAVGKAMLIVELDDLGDLVSGHLVDDIGDEYANAIQKTAQGVKVAGYTASYGIGNPQKIAIVDLYDNNTLLKAITVDGSGSNATYSDGSGRDAIYRMSPTSDGGFAFTGTYNRSGVVGKSDIYGEFPSNCTTRVTPSVIDITANITVRKPNITAVPFTPTIFNVTFTQKSAPIVVENPCVFTTPTPRPVPTPTPVTTLTPTSTPMASSILSSLTSATTAFATPMPSSVASTSTSSSSVPGSSTVSAISIPGTFSVIPTTDPIVIESGTPTVLPINTFSFTGDVNPEQLVFTLGNNSDDVVITVDGVEGVSIFTYAQLEGGFVSLELPGATCGYSGNLQLEATVAGSNAQPQQVNVPLLFEGTTCTTANTGRLLVFSRQQQPKQAAWPVESYEPVSRFKY